MRRPAYCTAKADAEPCLASEVVVRLASGALAPLERQAIERRLDECELCRRFVGEVLRQQAEATPQPTGTATALERPEGREGSERRERPEGREGREPDALQLPLPLPGQRIDRYVIERPLGAGGMGMVSLARDEQLKRHVVIKLVRPDLFEPGRPQRGETLEARLVREAQALARLSHPCVVSIYDIGHYGNQVFFAMEFVAGVDLASYLASAPRSHADILGKFHQAGAGLAAAHRAGVVHRDFKPANVLVGDRGVVKVADFGLARGVASPPDGPPAGASGRAPRSSMLDAALTHVDSTVGTPAYMAPEQIAGEGVDARSDQFAFAVALTDALLGQSPAARAIAPQTATSAELAELARALAATGLGAPQCAALTRALAQAPAARFASMEELLAALDPPPPLPPREPPPPMPPRRSGARGARLALGALALTAALAGVGALGWLATHRGTTTQAPSCATRRQQLEAAWSEAQRRQLVAELAGPAPFDRWTAEAAVAALQHRLERLGQAHETRCLATGPATATRCQLTTAAAVTTTLATLQHLDDVWTAAAALELCEPGAPSGVDPAARSQLAAAAAALAEGELTRASAAAREVAAELSTRAPLMAAEAWRIAAIAAQLGLRDDADDLTARCSADAERAGEDGRRAQALLLELDSAVARSDSARVEQVVALLRSLAARRGDRPIDRAEVESLVAQAHDRLGRYLTTIEEWARVRELAEQGELPALVARATLGGIVARARCAQARDEDRAELRRLIAAPPPLRGQPGWIAAVAAAVELAEPVEPEVLREAASALPLGTAATADAIGLRVAAARAAGEELDAWFATAIASATAQQRTIEAIQLAMAQARLALADRAGTAEEALRQVNHLLMPAEWSSNAGHAPRELQLQQAVLESDAVERGVLAADHVVLTRITFQSLPPDSLLRADAAWRYARHGKQTSRYLQGGEELEVAIPLWRRVGKLEWAATAAWWLAQDEVADDVAQRWAQTARELFRQLGDAAHTAEVEAWLAAHPPR